MPAPTSFSNNQLRKINGGLRNLDGVASDAGKFKRFEFDDDTSWDIAQNIVLVEDALRPFELKKKKLFAKHELVEGAPLTEENRPKYAAFMEDVEGLNDMTLEVPAIKFLSLCALRKGGKIPPSVLADLISIIKPE